MNFHRSFAFCSYVASETSEHAEPKQSGPCRAQVVKDAGMGHSPHVER
jgi:hypothetical protein